MAKTRRNLIIFIVIALASGWLGVLVDTFLIEQPKGDTLGMGLWLILPLLTAITLSIVSRDWKNAGLTPKLKGNLKWYLLSLSLFPAIAVVTLSAAKLFGFVDLSKIEIDTVLPLIATGFAINIIKNVFEEFAWRGFLTPKLIEMKINDWLLYLISGLVWGLWHVPYYLIFLDDSVFEALSVSRVEFVFIATMIILCWNVIYVELFRLAKSVFPCTIMHATEDGVVMFLFAGEYYVFTNNINTWIFDPHVGVVATVLVLGTGLILRSIRMKAQKTMKYKKQSNNSII